MPGRAQKLNVLITGATTSIGRHLAAHLVEDKSVGVVLGVATSGRPYYFNDLPADRFIYRSCDILKSREVKNLFFSRTFKNAQINAVVHLAFKTRVYHSEDVHALNVFGTKALIEHCLQVPTIKKFIFKSSDVVYKLRPRNPVFLDENADLNFDPDADQWVKDRVAADMICRSFMDNKKMRVVILRMSNIIGRNVDGQLNAYFDSRPIVKTLGFNPMINLLHMRDVIQAIKMAIFKRQAHGIYNIAGVDTAPISTIAELTGRTVLSLPEPVLPVVNKVQRMLRLTNYYYSVDKERQKFTCLLDASKARKELGYVPQGRIEF
ncbi:MAG: NAD-dependent epimerase/dehydratase family protein [Deltaproteobacteria bacterium]|nr:NAD-dependent epimerase/dehydratase family protein [Deltaproteobacteria bacterium]